MKNYLVSLFFVLVFVSCANVQEDQVCFDKKCVVVEIVQEPKELQRGLQHREFLGKDKGMLFIFSQNEKVSFWMKDTFIPLDMIWLDFSRKVVHIEKNVPPCKNDPCPTYAPLKKALYVLEVNALYTESHNIQLGDQAQFILK